MNKGPVGPAHMEAAGQQRKQTVTRELCRLEKLAGDAREGMSRPRQECYHSDLGEDLRGREGGGYKLLTKQRFRGSTSTPQCLVPIL